MTSKDILQRVFPLYSINKELMEYFQLQLVLGCDEVNAYLDKRKFSKEILDLFRIGYCPDAQTVYDFVLSRGWSEQSLQDNGFWSILDDNSIIVKFENRLMFPFSDVDGTVYGFSGRVLHDDKISNKYVNTTNCIVYNKGLIVYGFREALLLNKNNIDRWILVEGNADVLSMFQAGFTTTVACAGTAITEHHIRLLSRYSKDFVLLLDNDDAGKKATIRVSEIIGNLHLNWQIASLEGTKDVDEAIREGKTHLIQQSLG
jgi:DNA primase